MTQDRPPLTLQLPFTDGDAWPLPPEHFDVAACVNAQCVTYQRERRVPALTTASGVITGPGGNCAYCRWILVSTTQITLTPPPTAGDTTHPDANAQDTSSGEGT